MIPRFIILREGEHWAVGRHVATVSNAITLPGFVLAAGVPVYSLTDDQFDLITDATAWVAAQEGSEG